MKQYRVGMYLHASAAPIWGRWINYYPAQFADTCGAWGENGFAFTIEFRTT